MTQIYNNSKICTLGGASLHQNKEMTIIIPHFFILVFMIVNSNIVPIYYSVFESYYCENISVILQFIIYYS